MNMDDYEFERGENITIDPQAPELFRPSKMAWVISGRIIENELQANAVGYPIGSIIYLVEYEDGKDIELPVKFLRHRH